MKRKIALATASLLLLSSLAGCSAYNNPGKYVSLPELSTLTISQAKIDENLKKQIDDLLENNRRGDYKEVKEAAIKGDQLNINYEGKPTDSSLKLDEATLKGMKAEKADLVLGSNTFIGEYIKKGETTPSHKGFEDQLIGAKAGDTVEVKVKFPDSYSTKALQGVEVIFTVKVNTVSRLTVDEDTFVKIGYAFELVKDEEVKDETSTENKDETTTEPEAQAEEDSSNNETTENKDENKTPEIDDDKEDTKTNFSTLFKSGSFSFDYAKEADDKMFNDIFKIADFRDLFKGANLYAEIEKEVTVPKDVADKYKDYAETKIKITFTVSDATVLPEWNDELVKEITNETYTTVAAYKDAMLKDIKIDLALTAAEEAAKYDGYPKSEVKKLYKQYVDQLVANAAGKSLDELTNSELKKLISADKYKEIYSTAATQAMATVKSRLLIEYLCDELDIKITSKEYKAELKKTFEEYKADTSMMYYYYQYYGTIFTDAQQLEDYFGKDELELQFKTTKMSDALVAKVKVVD